MGFGWIALVLATLLATIGAISFLRLLDQRRAVIDEIGPAQTLSRDYRHALTDQEAGVRGFLTTGNASLLVLYKSGVDTQKWAEVEIGRLLQDLPRLRRAFDDATRLAGIWRAEGASPAILAKRSGLGSGSVERAARQSTERFNAFRTSFDNFARTLTQAHKDGRKGLNEATYVLVGVLILGAVNTAAAGIIASVSYHRWVAVPLRELGVDAHRVALGDLDHEVRTVGPAEIAELAIVLEGMRKRTLGDLNDVRLGHDDLKAEADKLERSNTHLEQFAYIASHDLQEPLRKVSAFCQLLEQKYADQLDAKAHQYIAFAVDGAQRMQNLVNDLLAFSRVGRDTPPRDQIDINDTVAAAVENLKLLLEETGATVESSNLPTVYGAKTLLISLFQNLVENAVKFRRPDVPIRVSIVAKRAYESWEIRITDNGIGIEAQYADRVFEVFQRLHSRSEYAGTGIGLAMCRKIVDYHGGTIRIERNDAPGTTFLVTLPGRIGDADRGRASSEADTNSPG